MSNHFSNIIAAKYKHNKTTNTIPNHIDNFLLEHKIWEQINDENSFINLNLLKELESPSDNPIENDLYKIVSSIVKFVENLKAIKKGESNA